VSVQCSNRMEPMDGNLFCITETSLNADIPTESIDANVTSGGLAVN